MLTHYINNHQTPFLHTNSFDRDAIKDAFKEPFFFLMPTCGPILIFSTALKRKGTQQTAWVMYSAHFLGHL